MAFAAVFPIMFKDDTLFTAALKAPSLGLAKSAQGLDQSLAEVLENQSVMK